MGFTDDELRSMVRASIARLASNRPGSLVAEQATSTPHAERDHAAMHVSFARFVLQAEGDDGGPCVIEPAVRCNHCGYCRSYGH